MIARSVARRYARAIFELAEEAGKVEEIGKQLHSVLELVRSHKELEAIFVNPAISPLSKRAVFDELEPLLGLEPLCTSAVRLLIRKGRIHYLEAIVSEYDERLRKRSGIVVAQVKTARPLTEEIKEELLKRLETISGKHVELQISVDPEIIGGLVARIGDTVYDGSVNGQLERMRQSLVEE